MEQETLAVDLRGIASILRGGEPAPGWTPIMRIVGRRALMVTPGDPQFQEPTLIESRLP